MGQVLHGCAKTTYAVRAELQRSKASAAALAERFGINVKTVLNWRKRESVLDRPMGAEGGTLDGPDAARGGPVATKLKCPRVGKVDVSARSHGLACGAVGEAGQAMRDGAFRRVFHAADFRRRVTSVASDPCVSIMAVSTRRFLPGDFRPVFR